MKKERMWDMFSPENKKRLRDIFHKVVGATVPLRIPGRNEKLTIRDESDFEFVLGNYSLEGERAGGSTEMEPAIMATADILQKICHPQ